uniref:DNA-binding protein RFX2 n=2 Tax=Ascaris TaxID=6251 RepID=F1KUU3_ASCSU
MLQVETFLTGNKRMKTTSVRRNPSTATVTTSARGSQPPPAAVPCTSTTVQTTPQPIQPKTAQVILVQKTPKLFLGKNGEAIQQIVLAQPAVAVSVSDADLRTHLSGGEAVETVSGVTAGDAFQQATAATQGGATVTYVSSGQASLAPSEGDFVTASQTDGVLVPQVVSQGTEDAEQTPQQHIGTMDAYPLGQHINTANATYVYTTDYPPYYQYQPLHSPSQPTYIIQQQNSPGSVDEDTSAQLGHTTRASPATIQWLINNYEPADGTSLPRCTLYSHYIKHCNENKLEPVNAASFGKLIRSVFHGLRTRRLGTRGNSKYHYYGIRIKPDSPLNRGLNSSSMSINEDYTRAHMITTPSQHIAQMHNRNNTSRRPTMGAGSMGNRAAANVAIIESSAPHSHSNNSSTSPSPGYTPSTQQTHGSSFQPYQNQSSNSSTNGENCAEIDREILGDGEVPQVPIPDMQGLENFLQPLGLSLQHAMRFIEGYTANCGEVLECVKQLQFEAVEECWVTFWQPENDQEEMEDDECATNEKPLKGLSQIQLFRLCTVPQMQTFVQNMDFAFYQVIAEVLIPDVLSSNMSSTLTTQIRNFAKSLEGQLKKAMQGAPDVIQKKKLVAVRMLAQTLRRYTSLNHLATAARGVLQKPDQIQQMYQDFNRVDISNVQDQAGWVCDCDPVLVSNLQSDFRENLQKQKTLEQWAEWMEAVVDQVLAKYHDKPLNILADVAKQFLKNWSFYSSMIIRDLTLRSAQSFGSFHLIRLLYDEYLLYLVELRLAKAANKPVISIMAQTSDSSTCVSSSPTVTVNSSLLNSGMGMMPAHTQHVFHTLENQQAVNILYVDETSGHQHTIHYVDMDNDTQMDALEQIVQSSEMTLDEVKNDLNNHGKEIDIM